VSEWVEFNAPPHTIYMYVISEPRSAAQNRAEWPVFEAA